MPHALPGDNNDITCDIKQQLERATTEWSQFLDRYNETNYPTYQEFEREFKAEVESMRYDFQVEPLNGSEIHKRLRKRKDSTAGGSDSWRTVSR